MENDWQVRSRFFERLETMGPLTFGEFMQEALIGPYGYYTARARIGGAEADFFTAAGSPLFGYTLANRIVQAWRDFAVDGPLRLVELGPGEGKNAVHMATRLLQLLPDEIPLSIVLVDPSEALVRRQKSLMEDFVFGLAENDRRRLTIAWETLPLRGEGDVVVVANEVLDALPVERLRKEKGWQRMMVKADGPDGLLTYWEAAPNQLAQLANRFLPIQEGTSAELCPQMHSFFESVGGMGNRVRALFIDYGITTEEWRSGIRPSGTVRAYRNHEICDVLEATPWCDITADVNWDHAFDAASAAGFTISPLKTQGSFLMEWGIMDVVSHLAESSSSEDNARTLSPTFEPQAARYAGQIKQLVFPGGMGERFLVMECEKV